MAKKPVKSKEPKAAPAAPKFAKDQILSFARYRPRRDLLQVILRDGVMYTIQEIEAEIERFLKGKVN